MLRHAASIAGRDACFRPFTRLCTGFFTAAILLLTSAAGLLPHGAGAAEPEMQTEAQRQAAYDQLAREQSQLEAHAAALKQVVRLVRPAVVHIEVTNQGDARPTTSRRGAADETGSGVIVTIEGKPFILTNRHLIRYSTPENISVRLADGRVLHPTHTWQDAGTDIAVMSIAGSGLLAARVGDSDRMEIGDFVLAIGSPFGLSHSVTHGIISAKGRRDLELATDGVNYQDFLQTDASINPGNSGGPLVNLRGEVVGINTAIASSSGHNEGIGFSIPANMVMIVAKQLIDRGAVIRGFLGVSLDSKFSATAAAALGLDRPRGARVTAITPGSPAAEAGIHVGDVILTFNGVPIDDDNHLVNTVSLTEVGHDVPLTVFRDRAELPLKVRIAQRDAAALK
ncbi:MAG: trypsin-like peptidase domain-containing protein [Planctomycetia bacterium]|nr:trypsin-like peptidase domain-containing protein [Planctomycetia bacterium]